MPEELLAIFKVCLLILLYLFFFRVLRAVWTEVNGTTSRSSTKRAAKVAAKESKRPAKSAAPLSVAVGAAAPVAASTATRVADGTPTVLIAREPAHIAGLRYTLQTGMTLGRGTEASVILDDSYLSQQHVAFERRGDGWTVIDLGSTNGTYLNSERVDRSAPLRVGDQVQIGSIVLEAQS